MCYAILHSMVDPSIGTVIGIICGWCASNSRNIWTHSLTLLNIYLSLSSTDVPPFANVQMLLALTHHAFFVDCVWNIIAHAQKPDFASRAKRSSPFKSGWGESVQSTTGSRGVRISGSNAGYTMFRGSVKSTGYPLHSPVSPSLPPSSASLCAITFQLDSTTPKVVLAI